MSTPSVPGGSGGCSTAVGATIASTGIANGGTAMAGAANGGTAMAGAANASSSNNNNSTTSNSGSGGNSDSILVAVRVRPGLADQAAEPTLEWLIQDNVIYAARPDYQHHVFTFDHILPPEKTNVDVYDKVVEPIITAVMDGYHGTVFAYGQTSSGKTHTMMGNDADPGVIRRAIAHIFERIHKATDREFMIRISYLEIYNEQIRDLLNPASQLSSVLQIKGPDMAVVGLTERVCRDADEMIALMLAGDKNRQVGCTNMNDRSSRSHTIFRVTLESSHENEATKRRQVIVSQLNLVDLAGSERITQTGATGTRLREGCHINTSLTALGMVIRKLSTGDAHINFRDSKLTRILQNSLGGNSRTAIICTISPFDYETSVSTLRFGYAAKRIKNRPVVNQVVSAEVSLLQRRNVEIESLKALISKVEAGKEQELKEKDETISLLKRKIEDLHRLAIGGGDLPFNVDRQNIVPSRADVRRRETWCPGQIVAATPGKNLVGLSMHERRKSENLVEDDSFLAQYGTCDSDTNEPKAAGLGCSGTPFRTPATVTTGARRRKRKSSDACEPAAVKRNTTSSSSSSSPITSLAPRDGSWPAGSTATKLSQHFSLGSHDPRSSDEGVEHHKWKMMYEDAMEELAEIREQLVFLQNEKKVCCEWKTPAGCAAKTCPRTRTADKNDSTEIQSTPEPATEKEAGQDNDADGDDNQPHTPACSIRLPRKTEGKLSFIREEDAEFEDESPFARKLKIMVTPHHLIKGMQKENEVLRRNLLMMSRCPSITSDTATTLCNLSSPCPSLLRTADTCDAACQWEDDEQAEHKETVEKSSGTGSAETDARRQIIASAQEHLQVGEPQTFGDGVASTPVGRATPAKREALLRSTPLAAVTVNRESTTPFCLSSPPMAMPGAFSSHHLQTGGVSVASWLDTERTPASLPAVLVDAGCQTDSGVVQEPDEDRPDVKASALSMSVEKAKLESREASTMTDQRADEAAEKDTEQLPARRDPPLESPPQRLTSSDTVKVRSCDATTSTDHPLVCAATADANTSAVTFAIAEERMDAITSTEDLLPTLAVERVDVGVGCSDMAASEVAAPHTSNCRESAAGDNASVDESVAVSTSSVACQQEPVELADSDVQCGAEIRDANTSAFDFRPSRADANTSAVHFTPSTADANTSALHFTPSTADANTSALDFAASRVDADTSALDFTPSTADANTSALDFTASRADVNTSTMDLTPSTADVNTSACFLAPTVDAGTQTEDKGLTGSGLSGINVLLGRDSADLTSEPCDRNIDQRKRGTLSVPEAEPLGPTTTTTTAATATTMKSATSCVEVGVQVRLEELWIMRMKLDKERTARKDAENRLNTLWLEKSRLLKTNDTYLNFLKQSGVDPQKVLDGEEVPKLLRETTNNINNNGNNNNAGNGNQSGGPVASCSAPKDQYRLKYEAIKEFCWRQPDIKERLLAAKIIQPRPKATTAQAGTSDESTSKSSAQAGEREQTSGAVEQVTEEDRPLANLQDVQEFRGIDYLARADPNDCKPS